MTFFDFLFKRRKTKEEKIICKELFEASLEYQIRDFCFGICTNMIANAIGRCEVKTYQGSKETQGEEYWIWNYQPNKRQNATAFMHELVARLYQDNEILIVDERERKSGNVVVAETFTQNEDDPETSIYDTVSVRGVIRNNVREKDVLHIKLNHGNMRPVLNGLYESYGRLVSAAMKAYEYGQGQHWKVHISQYASGQEGWADTFREMIEKQFKTFLGSSSAILPEFEGYKYEDLSQEKDKTASADVRALVEDIFNFTARGFLIPAVLVNGKIEGTENANSRFLTNCIDPLADQLGEEITRKRFGFYEWKKGSYVKLDTSSILHFDMFENAANVEKLIGSGAFSINDVLKAAGQATIDEDWANKHFITLNFTTIEKAIKGGETNAG